MFWLFLSSILCEYIDDDKPNFESVPRNSLCFCIEEAKDGGCKNQFGTSHPDGCQKMYGPKWYKAFSDTQNKSTVKLYVPNGYDFNGTIVLNKYGHDSTIYLPIVNRFSVNFNNQYHLTIKFKDSTEITKRAKYVTPLGSGVINATFPDVSADMWASGEGKALRDGPILDVKNSGFSGKYPVCDWSSFYCVILHENVNYILNKAPRILNLTDATEITLNDPGFTCTFTNTSIDIALNEISPKIQITKNIFSTPRIINLKEDTFKKNNPDILSPTFTITNDNCFAEPLNVKSEAALLTIDFHGSLNWVVTVKSDDWAPYRFVDFLLGSKYISGAKPVETHFTGSLSLIMETGKPIVGINSFNDDIHVYLNHSDVVLASVVKMSYKDINIESLNFHIVPLTSNATNFYVSNSYKVNYYVDNKEPTVNVYISESYLDNFFTSNAKYIVQNKIVFPETYHDSSEKKSYQYGVFARGSTDDEAIGVNEFVNNINNLEILNGSYIDLESYEKLNWKLPLYLNENITFSGSKYYIATNIHREGISFDNYPKESKLADNEMPDSKRFYVMCQPNLDCNKFVISPKSDKYYINSDNYWQQEGAITTVCDKYSTIWPQRERMTENNPCCKEFLASNEATDSMTCVGYRIDKKLETEYKVKYIASYPELGSLFTEDGFIQWHSQMIHGGVRAISYNDIHPLQVLPNLELKKVNLYVEDTNSIIIDQHYQNAFSILYADDIFFRFRNPSDKVIPFEYIHLTGKILNPNLADLDWSRVKKIDLYSSFYNQNLDLFRNISDIIIRWDTYEQDFENALNQIKDGDKFKIYIDFTDLGVNVHTNVTKFKALTLFNTQRYRQVYLNLKNAMKIDNPISFSNLAIDYHISFTQSEWTLKIGNIASQKVEFSDVNNLKVIFQEPLVNQFKVNLTNLRTLTFEYEGNQAGLTKSFSFGYVHSNYNIIIKYLANSHNFTETVIDYLDIRSSSTISAQNKNRGPMNFKVGILDVRMNSNSNSYTIPSNMEVTGTINSMMSDGTLTIPEQQYIPNLNIISGNAEKRPKIVFTGDRVSVNKITLTIGKLSSCDNNWEIYRRVFKERFANNSYYGKLRNSHILTCADGPVIPWKSFTPSSEFEYCDKQFATVNLFEVKLTTEEARAFWNSESELDEYTCLAYEFNLTNIDKSMTTNYYVDTITEDIFSYEVVDA